MRLVILGGVHRYLLWSEGEGGTDRVDVENGRVLVFPTETAARANLLSASATHEGLDGASILDFTELERWLSGARSSIPADAALNLWNLAIDVSASLGSPWDPSGGIEYNTLFAANVPWVMGMNNRIPRWTPHQLARLRRVLSEAYGIIRAAL